MGTSWPNKTTVFAQLNFENLTQEMAQGQGEPASLATLMAAARQHAAFFAMTQERYISLVNSRSFTSCDGQSDQ